MLVVKKNKCNFASDFGKNVDKFFYYNNNFK